MAIDPSIYSRVQPLPFNNPFEQLAQLRDQQEKRKAQQQELEIRQQQLAQGQQRIDLEKGQIAEAQKAKLSADQVKQTAEQAYSLLSSGKPEDREKILTAMPPQSRVLAEQWLQGFAESKKARETQGLADAKAAAKLIQAMDYDPVTAATTMRMLSDAYPNVKPLIDQATNREKLKPIIDHFATLGDAPVTLNQGDKRISASGQTIAENPAVPKAPAAPNTVDEGIYAAAKAGDGKELKRLLDVKAQMATATREPKSAEPDKEPLVAIMGPDGKPVLVRRSQAEGKSPANTREQGRPVTSGDAGRVAELNTSLDNLDALDKEVGKTGAGSWIGAHIPNPITEYTGVGTESKARQGVIDRVKQMIGKALEGGVLRKEDEVKYTKILPTIGDPPDVAKAKLDGLRELLLQKRQNTLDALKDANYDISQFEKRAQAPRKPTADELIKKYGG